MPFGLGKSKKQEQKEKPEIFYYARYLGGHKRFPKPEHTQVHIFPDRIEVHPFGLRIPYSSITGMEKLDKGKKISADRLLELGMLLGIGAIAGLVWKKHIVCTVIHYNDGAEVQSIILDFGENLKYAHPIIFERMTKSWSSGQTSVSTPSFTIKSDKPELLVSMQVGFPVINRGNEQNIKVGVYDAKSNEKVIGAIIKGDIISRGGTIAKLEEDVTDNGGQVSYTWKIPDNSELGSYTMTFHIVASGYRSSITKTSFEVI